jgi:DNA-binding GntR family transcriptional regulator
MMLARAAIESMIARQAARRATPEQVDRLNAVLDEMRSGLEAADVRQLIDLNERFHNAIHEASGCEYLRRLQSGQNIYNHATRLSILADKLEQRLAVDEHQAIARAIAAREPDVAERLMRDHVIRSGEKHLALLSKAGK